MQRYSTQKPKLSSFTKKQYYQLLLSGLFWKLYPEATGEYEKDCLAGLNLSTNKSLDSMEDEKST